MGFNLNKKFNEYKSVIKSMEGQCVDKVKTGTKEPSIYLDMAYYSGIHNAFNFVNYVYQNPKLTEQEVDALFKEMMHFDAMKVN